MTIKERVTLTLEKSILKSVDETVDGHRIKNRSHAVELLLLKSLGEERPKVALILAGGKGTRMKPITYETPKALLPIHDRVIIEHLFDLLKKYYVRNIILAVGHKKDKIKLHLGNGEKFGVSIKYIEEESPLGTGGAVKQAEHIIESDFIVSNCDELKNIDILDMYRFHREKKAIATVALTTVSDPQDFGVASLSGSRILEFTEKPKKGSQASNLINAGFYIFSPTIFDYIPKGSSSLEKEIFPILAKQGKLYGYPFSGQWFDTGTMPNYEKALKNWIDIE